MQAKFNIFFNISHNDIMIDLIEESAKDFSPYDKKIKTDKKYAVEVAKFSVASKQEEKHTGFVKGDYVILSAPLTHYLDKECHDYIAKIVQENLKCLMKKNEIKKGFKVLIVGLGNPDILADSLGIKVIEKIEINPLSNKKNVFKFCPNIFMATGIDSLDVIHMLVVWLDVDYVILIDSLATKNARRLGVSIQLNSAGITPGSAVHKLGRTISKDSLGVPCFSIGVPLMLLADSIENAPEDLILTLKDIHENLDNLAYIISSAINQILS